MQYWRLTCATALVLIIGCGGGTGSSSKISLDDSKRLQNAASMFSFYVAEHGGKAPPDELAFRTFLESKKEHLEKMGVTVDELLTSPRNSEPMMFVYGKKPIAGPGVSYVAYEKTPVEGKRLVIATRGFEEMDEAQFKKFFPDVP